MPLTPFPTSETDISEGKFKTPFPGGDISSPQIVPVSSTGLSRFTLSPFSPISPLLAEFEEPRIAQPSSTEVVVPEFVKSAVDIFRDPLTLKENIFKEPKQALQDVWTILRDPVLAEKDKIADLFKPEGVSDVIGDILGTTAGAGHIVFSPISAFFTGAEKIPILGTVSKIITLPFIAVGEAGVGFANSIVDLLPIPDEAKANIAPGLGEIFALAGQLALGKTIPLDRVVKLKERFGEKDAKVIVEKAVELAEEKKIQVVERPIEQVRTSDIIDIQKTNERVPVLKNSIKVNSETKDYNRKSFDNYLDSISGDKIPMTHETELSTAKQILKGEELGQGEDIFASLGFLEKPDFVPEGVRILFEVPKSEVIFSLKDQKALRQKYAIGLDTMDHPSIGEFLGREGHVATPFKNEWIVDIIDKDGNSLMKKLAPEAILEEVGKVEPVKAEGEIKERGLARGIEEKAVEEGLTKGFGDLPEYQVVNMKEQARLASDLLKKDPESARDIALGKKNAPEGLIPEAVLVAVENKAILEGDVATLRDLATISELTGQATGMGQRIRTLGERNPESPVGQISELKQAREAKVKDLPKKLKTEVDEAKTEIRKKAPKYKDWSEFLDSLKC